VVIDGGRVIAAGIAGELKDRTGGTSCVITPADPARLAEVGVLLGGVGSITFDDDAGTEHS
jgi:hypothetical protein